MSATIEISPSIYLQRNADRSPSEAFLITDIQTLSNRDALEFVKKLAYEFRRVGIRPGDLVAVDVPAAVTILFLQALLHEAAISSMVPVQYGGQSAVTPRWIFSSEKVERADNATVVLVDTAFLARVEQNPYGITARSFESETSVARLSFSSGTTGTPKAIALTLEMLEFRSDQAANTWMQGAPFLCLLDTKTVLGYVAFYGSVRANKPLLVGGDPRTNHAFAAREAVTSLKASPAQLATFIEHVESDAVALPSLSTVFTVGSVLPPHLAERVRRAMPGCSTVSFFGTSEASVATIGEENSVDPLNVGRPTPETEIQIVTAADQPLPDGQVGLLRYRRPHMVHEYLGSPEATARSFVDGWFYSGDTAAVQPDGSVVLHGRASEILNAGGVKLDPTQLDLFAIDQQGVVDACSFAYTALNGMEQIGIALVVNTKADVEQLVRDFDREFGQASPRLVARVDSIPRNATGKPLRRQLAADYEGQ